MQLHAGRRSAQQTCSGGAQACVLYTMRSRATVSTWPGEKQGSAFSPAISTPAADAASLTCQHTAPRLKQSSCYHMIPQARDRAHEMTVLPPVR